MPDTSALAQLWDTLAVQHVDPEQGDPAHEWNELPENTRAAIRQLVETFTEPGEVTGAAADQVFVWRSQTDDQWHWHRVAANHEVISDGEAYVDRNGGIDGAHRANPDLPDTNFHIEDAHA